MPKKPGGGNHLQPYLPRGHGSKSGEYTNEKNKTASVDVKHKAYVNAYGKFNPFKSTLVRFVNHTSYITVGGNLPTQYKPNSVAKVIEGRYVIRERYYNENGDVYLDIDYTCHGNPKTHPHVPHIHRWTKTGNKFEHMRGEEFQ